MSLNINEKTVVVDLNFNQEYDKLLTQICDGFAEILRHDIHVSKIICSSETKQTISKYISGNETEYKFEEKLFGATYLNDETIPYSRIMLFGCRDQKGCFIPIISKSFFSISYTEHLPKS